MDQGKVMFAPVVGTMEDATLLEPEAAAFRAQQARIVCRPLAGEFILRVRSPPMWITLVGLRQMGLVGI